jgi:phosphomannomutase
MDLNSNRTKEELYSQSISAGKRKYFFDVKETRGGDKFIVIAESRKLFDNNTGNFYFEKNKMFLYKEDFEKFQKGLNNAINFIETGIIPEEENIQDERDTAVDHHDDIEDIFKI